MSIIVTAGHLSTVTIFYVVVVAGNVIFLESFKHFGIFVETVRETHQEKRYKRDTYIPSDNYR